MPSGTKRSADPAPSLLFADQASNPAVPPSGQRRAFTKTGGLYTIDDAGVVAQVSAGAQLIDWTREAEHDLSTLTGLTTNGATWSIDAGTLLCTSTSASWRTVRIDDDITPRSSWAIQVEMQLEATFGSGEFIRLAIAASTELAANNNFHGWSINGNGTTEFVIGAGATSGPTVDVAAGWHTAMFAVTPYGMVVYWDGVEVGGRSAVGTIGGAAWRPFVWVYGGLVPHFRNMVGWSGTSDVVGTLP